jgi:hypothetical protein
LHRYLTQLLIFLSVFRASGQTTGKIEGKVFDDSSGEELVGVSVSIGNRGTYTNESGYFSLSYVSAGNFFVKFSLPGYREDSVSVNVDGGKTIVLNFRMVSVDVEMEAVKIVGERSTLEATDVSIISLMRTENKAVVALGKQQIARTQDRDAAQAMRRIPGLSVNNGRFVSVRGLNERYNAVLLNGVFAPSAEPDVKAFSFDAVSSGTIERIVVAKSPSPELPGDFAGGVI